jgi:sulfide:quinone oxidoreductase
MERRRSGHKVDPVADNGHVDPKQRALIAGGGVGGIEVALALDDLAGGRLEVDIFDPRREFVFKPFGVSEPYGASRAFRYGMRGLAKLCGAAFHASGISSVDSERRFAVSSDGERVPYDYLIVASGARALSSVPGAVTFRGIANEGQVGDVLADLRAGRLRHVVFTMCSGPSWVLPLYELALRGATELEKAGNGDGRVTVVTPEDAPLNAFGRSVGERMRALLAERGVGLVSAHPIRFDRGRLRAAPGKEIEADAVIALPRFEGRRIGGIPHDREGFVTVDEHGAVIGLNRVYAAGDVTAFPIKQGGIASQQADTVAEAIAAATGAGLEPRPFDPILRGVLWTGREPRYLYGRLTGGHGEACGFSIEPEGPLRDGKVTARYLTPLVDSLEQAADPEGSLGAVRVPSAG